MTEAEFLEKANTMTEEELIEVAKTNPHFLMDVDKALLTKPIIDNIRIVPANIYGYILNGVDPSIISKEKALEMARYSRDIYKSLPEELKEDKDILEKISYTPHRIPVEFFQNKVATQYFLDKWNEKENSWALIGRTCVDGIYIIVKPDINQQSYFFYPYGHYQSGYNTSFFDLKKLKVKTIEEEAETISHLMSEIFMCSAHFFSKKV